MEEEGEKEWKRKRECVEEIELLTLIIDLKAGENRGGRSRN